jgi:hypothetical protein
MSCGAFSMSNATLKFLRCQSLINFDSEYDINLAPYQVPSFPCKAKAIKARWQDG